MPTTTTSSLSLLPQLPPPVRSIISALSALHCDMGHPPHIGIRKATEVAVALERNAERHTAAVTSCCFTAASLTIRSQPQLLMMASDLAMLL